VQEVAIAPGPLAAPIIKLRCRFCGKFRHPREFVHDAVVGYCFDCYDWHRHALEMLTTGGFPRGCQVCGRSYDELERLNPRGDVKVTLQPKDGLYQILCQPCTADYERKRLDLYGSTPYGEAKKLKGAR
jgi:hypothetical protein